MFLRHNFMFTLVEMLLKRVCSMLSRIIAVQSLYYQFSVYQAVKTYLQVLTDKAIALYVLSHFALGFQCIHQLTFDCEKNLWIL